MTLEDTKRTMPSLPASDWGEGARLGAQQTVSVTSRRACQEEAPWRVGSRGAGWHLSLPGTLEEPRVQEEAAAADRSELPPVRQVWEPLSGASATPGTAQRAGRARPVWPQL